MKKNIKQLEKKYFLNKLLKKSQLSINLRKKKQGKGDELTTLEETIKFIIITKKLKIIDLYLHINPISKLKLINNGANRNKKFWFFL